MTRTLLLWLHIASVAAWLGANFVQLVLSPRFAKGPADVAAAWTRQTIWLGERYYNAAGAVLGVTGVLLVLDGDWPWGTTFLWVGIAVLVIGGAMGGLLFGPLAKRRVAALESGDALPPSGPRAASSRSPCSTPRSCSSRCGRWWTSGASEPAATPGRGARFGIDVTARDRGRPAGPVARCHSVRST
ncbi:MAG TPA: DUF2269 family protein [Acidimicrobiales bacterium]|nr:DUF2269 family protein [Acidimicrobiales bacterium]